MDEERRRKRRHCSDSSSLSDEGKARKTKRTGFEQTVKKKKSEKESREERINKNDGSSSSRSESEHSNSSDYAKKRKKRKDRDKARRKKEKRKKKRERKEKKRKRRKEREEKKSAAGKTMEKDVCTKFHSEAADTMKTDPADLGCDETPKKRAMVPMTKEEYEKQQAQVRRVYDPETGRHRLVKGTGEVLEEIVSRDRHKAINKTATQGDGAFFQANLGLKDK